MAVEHWIWLQQVLGYGSSSVARVIEEYGTAEEFYRADDMQKIKRCHLNKTQAGRLHSVLNKTVFGIINICEKTGISIITPEDDNYPERLLNIADPPAVLYVKGSRFDFNNNPSITIVGPRKCSEYGCNIAKVISSTLASCGFTIVSGCALGGDSAAHIGAMNAGGYTIGVLAAGINDDYLKANSDLREQIAKNGCLLSEFAPNFCVQKGNFQIRNRILSGLSNGVVIIEGAKKSGTMITARHAVEQNKDIFVIPGNPTLPQYEGSNRLIADGAKILLDVNDIISEYIGLYPDKIYEPLVKNEKSVSETEVDNSVRIKASPDIEMLSDKTADIFNFLQKQDTLLSADYIAEICNINVDVALSAITELEICGFIEAVPGGRYRII